MSAPERDQLIIFHPQLNGEPASIAEMLRENQLTPAVGTGSPAPVISSHAIEDGASETPKALTDRALSIDVIRGFFLLVMTFSMTIPSVKGMFPDWMYHMQYPPPDQFIDRSGVTWRDLLFPGFLFTMCAAIPITNSLRLAKRMPYPGIIWIAVKRFVVLYLFALIIGHVLPYWTHDYTKRGNVVSIIGFLACWPMFMRKPASWRQETFDRFRRLGWVAGAAILFALPRAYGARFDITHIDDIIQALAFVSLVMTMIWLFTRTNIVARLVLFGVVLALTIADTHGLTDKMYHALSAPRFYEPWMVELLLIGIPGTIAGDMIMNWMRHSEEERIVRWGRGRLVALVAVCLATLPVGLIGFYQQRPTVTAAGFAALAVLGFVIVAGAQTPREKILTNLFRLAALLLVSGALTVPLGGIKKDPQTLSYLLYTAGTSLCFLLTAIVITDVFKVGRRVMQLFVDVGQNPLIAYVAFMMFFNNISWLTPFGPWQQKNGLNAILGGFVFVGLTAWLAIATTRRRIFWRA